MIALDSNILVYAHRDGAPEHRAARAAVERACDAPSGCGLSIPVVAEFWSVVTHPESSGGPSSPDVASRFLSGLIETGGVRIWLPGEGFERRLAAAARSLGVSGPRIFDLQIALIAIEAGAREIWTHDGRFLKVPGLRVRDPLS